MRAAVRCAYSLPPMLIRGGHGAGAGPTPRVAKFARENAPLGNGWGRAPIQLFDPPQCRSRRALEVGVPPGWPAAERVYTLSILPCARHGASSRTDTPWSGAWPGDRRTLPGAARGRTTRDRAAAPRAATRPS